MPKVRKGRASCRTDDMDAGNGMRHAALWGEWAALRGGGPRRFLGGVKHVGGCLGSDGRACMPGCRCS